MVKVDLSSSYFSECVSSSSPDDIKRHEQAFMCKEHLKCYDLHIAVPSEPHVSLQDSMTVVVHCVAPSEQKGQGVAQMSGENAGKMYFAHGFVWKTYTQYRTRPSSNTHTHTHTHTCVPTDTHTRTHTHTRANSYLLTRHGRQCAR